MQQFFLVATRDSERIYGMHGRSVGYLHLWTGTNPLFLAALNGILTHFEQHHVAALNSGPTRWLRRRRTALPPEAPAGSVLPACL
jgi:hypothetical protein